MGLSESNWVHMYLPTKSNKSNQVIYNLRHLLFLHKLANTDFMIMRNDYSFSDVQLNKYQNEFKISYL